jgi:hypothetical protein
LPAMWAACRWILFCITKTNITITTDASKIGLRRFYGEPSISGYLVIQPEQVTHKLVGIKSCLFIVNRGK